MLYEKAQILWNSRIGYEYYKMGLKCQEDYSYSKPGQFVMLRPSNQAEPFLSRPFSIHKLIFSKERNIGIELLYKVVGKCTKKLSTRKKNDAVNVLGPLGNGFTISSSLQRIFIVAGGVGIAPMLFLTLYLRQKNFDVSKCAVFLGGQSKDDLLCVNSFLNIGIKVIVATNDGSEGKKGFVTDILETAIQQNKPDIIFACGPFPMLQTVAQMAKTHTISCQVSVETKMACGIGACLGCALESKNPSSKYLHACVDGPVFDVNTLEI